MSIFALVINTTYKFTNVLHECLTCNDDFGESL